LNKLLPVLSALIIAVILCWARPVLSHETVTTTVLFDREIVRILNSHCVMCHVDEGPAFPLVTYEQVWLQKRKISAAVIARHMPPWSAFSGYGRFANENIITLRESQFIVSWMEGLGPRNAGTVFTNTADPNAPKPQIVRAHPDFGSWKVGRPDLIRELDAIVVAPQESDPVQDDVRRIVVDLGLTAPSAVRALEYMPGDRRVVRAAVFTVQETGQWIGSWTPWYGFVKLPQATVYRLPAGAHVVAEVHYQHLKERVTDRGRLGLFFENRSASRTVTDVVIEARGEVPGGATAHRFHAVTTMTADTTVLALRPELQPGIRSLEVSARRPDGGTDVLLFAKDIALSWPTPYIYADPVVLRGGTVLAVTAYYANAGKSPAPAGIRIIVSGCRTTTGTRPRK
jgi:hypothetical protein